MILLILRDIRRTSAVINIHKVLWLKYNSSNDVIFCVIFKWALAIH